MLTKEQKKTVYDALVTNFQNMTIEGVDFTVAIRYANQYAYDVFPAIVLEYTGTGEPSKPPLDFVREAMKKPTDEITYNTGVNVYDLVYEKVLNIISVTGTVSGDPYTFDPAEYKLNIKFPAADEIEFLGTTYPDDGTIVEVNYKCATVIKRHGSEYRDLLSINVFAKDYDDREGGGSFVSGIIIANYIVNEVKEWFELVADFSGTIVVKEMSVIRNLDELVEDDWTRRRQFNAYLHYNQEVETTVESIEECEPSVSVE